MQLSGNFIFHWIHKRWTKAIHLTPDNNETPRITRPMFWSSMQEMRGHLVVITRAQMLQIDRHFPNTIFLVLDCASIKQPLCNNEFILLPNETRYDKVFNKLCSIIELFESWEDTLEQALTEFHSYEAIIRSCDQLVECPFALLNSEFRYVAYSKRLAVEHGFERKYVDKNHQLTLEAVNYLTAQPDFISLESKHDVFAWTAAESTLNINIYDDDVYIARLMCPVQETDEENAYYSDILRVLKRYIDELYAKLHSFFQNPLEHTRFGSLLVSLLDGMTPPKGIIASQIEAMGFNKNDTYYLIQLKSHTQNSVDRISSVLTNQIDNLWPQGVCFISNNKCYLLINLTQHEQHSTQRFTQELIVFLRESLMIAGMSRKLTNLLELPVAARQTEIAFELGRKRDYMYWYYKFDDYAFEYLVLHGMRGFQPHQICAPVPFILKHYDQENKTELNKTLKTFIQLRYNAASSAKELFIARSSFLKRLDRIHELTNVNLENFETRVYLALSYQILQQQEDSADWL